jgi:hypothetical protein
MNEALRQALELQAVLLAARPHKMSTRTFWGSQLLPPQRRDQRCRRAEAVENQATFRATAPMEGRQKTMTAMGNNTTDLLDTREPPRKSEWGPSNKEADRRDGQLLGNERVAAEKGRHWGIH